MNNGMSLISETGGGEDRALQRPVTRKKHIPESCSLLLTRQQQGGAVGIAGGGIEQPREESQQSGQLALRDVRPRAGQHEHTHQ